MATTEEQDIESRYIRLMLSSMLKAMDTLHTDIDVSETVRRHMLGICDGVRTRAVEANGETAHVDRLIAMIEESFAYAALPQFGEMELTKVESD